MGMTQYHHHPDYATLEDVPRWFGTSLKLDLGCGFYKPTGYVELDNGSGFSAQIMNAANTPDILINLNRQSLPFSDNSCVDIQASHFVEHCNLGHVFSEASGSSILEVHLR